MSTFYVLPPRPLLGIQIVASLQRWFPGLEWREVSSADLAETISAIASRHSDIYVVFREDLPEGVELKEALAAGFGACAGDEIVEVTGGGQRRWQLAA